LALSIVDPISDADLVLRNLAIAVTAGFVIGFEREWTQALEKQQHTFAGARTFALIGMIGGVAGILDDSHLIAAAALLVVGALTIVGYWFEAKETPGRGGTTEMAIFVTLLLGVAAGRGQLLLASAGAVTTAIILSLKSVITGWALALDKREIHATLRFLAVSILILPVLPNEQFGPFDALNLRELWTMVVLISGLSFVGYWLIRILGDGRGVFLTGAVGGLASSTATTLSLSQFAREKILPPSAVAAGVIFANVVMLLRVGAILAALSQAVFAELAPTIAAAAVVGSICGLFLWRTSPKDAGGGIVDVGNPFELRPAILFASVIALISIASSYGVNAFGPEGAYVVGAISGLADVDAMTLSGARQAATGALGADVAAGAILLAIATNIVVKGVIAFAVGGENTGFVVFLAFTFIIAAGAAAFALI